MFRFDLLIFRVVSVVFRIVGEMRFLLVYFDNFDSFMCL